MDKARHAALVRLRHAWDNPQENHGEPYLYTEDVIEAMKGQVPTLTDQEARRLVSDMASDGVIDVKTPLTGGIDGVLCITRRGIQEERGLVDAPMVIHPQVIVMGNVTGNLVQAIKSHVHDIYANIGKLASEDEGESFNGAVQKVTEAVGEDPDMNPEAKNDTLELLETVTEQATLPPDKRKIALVKTVIEKIADYAVTATAGLAWKQFGSAIEGYFFPHNPQ